MSGNEDRDAALVSAGEQAKEKINEVTKSEIRDIEFEGYKFQVDNEVLDDVELLEMIDGIENGERPALIITLLQKLVGEQGYDDMKAHFVKKDGRFKMSKLGEIYKAIFDDFDPKG